MKEANASHVTIRFESFHFVNVHVESYFTVNMYQCVRLLACACLSHCGIDLLRLLVKAIKRNVAICFQALNEIDTNLDAVIADKNTLVTAANTLSSSLSTLKSAIDSTKSGCSSDCTPTTVCNSFDTSSMTMNADFSTV